MRPAWKAACAAAWLSGSPAHALPPDQIFERVAPAVWSVKAYTAEEKLLASGSGIVVAPGKLVTSCQVLARARLVQLRRGNTIFEAKLEHPDVERDLCQLDAPGLSAPAPAVGSARALKPGQRLYVVGFARGNEQSIGEGLVSVVSQAGSSQERIQTTVPTSPGLMGAGVFDDEARLVGIVTSSPKDAAASAFAVPADWVPEVAARGAAALAARYKPAAAPAASAGGGAAAPGLPAAGSSWTYAHVDRQYSRRQTEFTVQVLRVDGAAVEEAVSASAGASTRRVVNSGELRILEQPFNSSVVLMELAPYMIAANGGKAPADPGRVSGYPIGGAGLAPWITRVLVQDWEQVTVPAGTFRVLRVEVNGDRERPAFTNVNNIGRFRITAWFAPEVNRYVRLEHRTWSGSISGAGQQSGDEAVELLKYVPGT